MGALDVAERLVATKGQEVTNWHMLIGGEWAEAQSGGVLEVYDPGRGAPIATVPRGGAADVASAVAHARLAFEDQRWASQRAERRGEILWALADLLESHGEKLATVEALNQGMPVGNAVNGSIPSAVRCFRYYAGWADKMTGTSADIEKAGFSVHAYTRKEPVGVVGLITPWNAPLVMAAWKVAPALAAGCSCVLKPAEETPLTALCLAELAAQAGVPAGVLNVVTGSGEEAGAPLSEHDDVDKIAFTGSTEVGRRIIRAAVPNLKKVSLELGGKSPVIVCDDADLERAIQGAAGAIFANAGQVCTAGSRLIVDEKVASDVVAGVKAIASEIRLGYCLAEDSEMGPLVSQKQQDTVVGYIAAGREEGAEVVSGGDAPSEGYFVAPTILVNARADMRAVREEIFGPVLSVLTFQSLDEAVAMANATRYGLAASVWTENMGTARRLSRAVRAGRVGVNVHGYPDITMPTGGYKESGWGRELGREGIEAFCETKSVFAR